MSRPVTSRVLFGLASLLFASGCSLGFLGLHPAVRKPALCALGMMLAVTSMPPWMAVGARQNRDVREARLNDARLSGYETGATPHIAATNAIAPGRQTVVLVCRMLVTGETSFLTLPQRYTARCVVRTFPDAAMPSRSVLRIPPD